MDYSIESVKPTETAVIEDSNQITTPFDFQRGLYLLQLYQFYPQLSNKDLIFIVLSKALMALPNSDFTACLALIPEKHIANEPLSILVQADTLLETGEFVEFWKFIEPHKSLFTTTKGFFEAVSSFILGVIELTFRKLPRKILLESLNIQERELNELIMKKKWTVSDNDLILPEPVLPKRTDKSQSEVPTSLEQLSKVLSVLQ